MSFLRPFLLAALLPCAVLAQAPWRSSLYPENWTPPTGARFETDKLIQDFSYAGYHRGERPLPQIAGPVFDVLQFGADPTGNADSTTALQRAIDAAAAAGGGVVRLPRGTFRVAPQGTNTHALRISTHGIVLRGAGPRQTFIFNDATAMRGKGIIRVDGSGSSWSTVPAGSPQPAITTDLPGPTTVIPVASVEGFAVGDWIVVRANATDAFVAEHNITDLWAGQASGLVGVLFLRQITAIDRGANQLTIDVPTRYYLKTRDNARVHRAVPHVEEIGLEDFSIGNREHPLALGGTRIGWGEEDYNTEGNGAYDAHGSHAIALRRVRNSWISNVASYRPAANTLDTHILSNGIHLENCRGVTVRHCDFQRPLFGGGGGNGYMYRIQATNECLIRDSAARYSRHNFVFSHMSCSGNVILGGLGQVTATQIAGSIVTAGEGSDHHMHLSQSNLIDGVELDRDFFTAHYRGTAGTPPQHGQGGTHSVFWNLLGLAYDRTKTYIARSEQARYGYIVGTRGPASGITTSSGAPAARTAPVDHTEGVGQGDLLQPLSLYHDQLARRLGTTPPPPNPTFVRPQAGVAEVRLAWNAAPAATGYRIRRATTPGGPYTTLGTTAATSFTDGSAVTGTTYHYVVAAVNAAGESSGTFEAGAQPMPAYRQDPGADGLVVIEVENADASLAQGGHSWIAASTAGFSGPGALAALPNSGTTRDTAFLTTSPRLDFRIQFSRTGTHHVWLRGLGPSGSDDSVHVGLDGVVVPTSDRITNFPPAWGWSNATVDGPVATLEIATPGVHTLNVWMREDGVQLDRLLLTTDAAYTPAGAGPPESPRLGSVLAPPAAALPVRIVNLATRALVGGEAGTPIAGFVIGGTGSKRTLVRAVGPGLAAFGLTGTVPTPSLTVVGSQAVLARADRWNPTDVEFFRALGAFTLPAGSRDAAVVADLAAGAYSTPVGAGPANGIALLEIYDATPGSADSSLVNASTRAFVGTGDAVLIPGFTLAGTGNARLLIRAVGPTLAGFGVPGALADPQLTLFRGSTTLAANDNWSSAADAAALAATAAEVGAFPLPGGSRDAALLVTLPAGSYTATVSGTGNTTGTALVELYLVR